MSKNANAQVATEKVSQVDEEAKEAQNASQVATVATTIANVEVELPVRFLAGHVISESEAKTLDAAYRRQFANNKNAAFKAWEAKVKALKAGEVTPPNPCTAETLLQAYVDYAPNVGEGEGLSSLERMRLEAGQRAFVELVAEHNKSVEATGSGPLGSVTFKMPAAAKGASEEEKEAVKVQKAALVAKLLASPKQASRVQRHLDLIVAEREAKKAETKSTEAQVISADIEF